MTNAQDPDKKAYTFIITRFEYRDLINYGVTLHTSDINGVTPDNYEYYTNLPKGEKKQLEDIFEKKDLQRALRSIFDNNPELKKMALEVKVKSSEIKEKTPRE